MLDSYGERWLMLVLPEVKRLSGMQSRGGVNRLTVWLSPQGSFPGQLLINALVNDQRRGKLRIPLHRVNTTESTATENGATGVTRLPPNVAGKL